MNRREWMGILASLAASAGARAEVAPRRLVFPADFGAHPGTRTEWWYLTGELHTGDRAFGFQVTFFRSRTGVATDARSRFAPTQLVFAHAALSEVQARRLRHDQRIARAGFGIAEAAEGDTDVRLHDWSLRREGEAQHSRYRTVVASDSAAYRLDLQLAATQPLLLQGDAGYSRKGPQPGQASHYYSQPQLAARGTLTLDGRALPVEGRAWLDHEWSDTLLDPEAVGWDWIGINLDDGSALTAFRLRRADGSALYAGGSMRAPRGPVRSFGPGEVRFTPGTTWRSPASQARYPVQWTVETPAGRHTLVALFDAQELDSRQSTGGFYWEGLSELRDDTGRRLGRGYLEMTGYASRLQL
ncbi:MAG: carotenoid 1,2-hydratase [Rhizobacter sp.]|nr:carotenoid 1,2-hydratase [Rhizobacter sp.]